MSPIMRIDAATIGGNEVRTVNARELHAFLEVGRDFSNWMRERVESYGFVEGADYLRVSAGFGENLGGRPKVDYHLSLDMAKELSMVERNAKGKEARRYFIECERRSKEAARPLSQLEILAQSAQALLEIERQQNALAAQVAATAESLARIDTQLEQVAANRVWDRCPQNCEPITKIRARIGRAYGIPPWVIDMVMRQLPLSPKVHAMIKNAHEGANGSQYEVWAVADVTRVFARFMRECKRVTPSFAKHPDIKERFRVNVRVGLDFAIAA